MDRLLPSVSTLQRMSSQSVFSTSRAQSLNDAYCDAMLLFGGPID